MYRISSNADETTRFHDFAVKHVSPSAQLLRKEKKNDFRSNLSKEKSLISFQKN